MSAPSASARNKHGFPQLVRQLAGLPVRLLRPITTGSATYPQGAVATIRQATSWERLTLYGEPCACCGVRLIIARVSWRDVEVITE